MDGKKQIWVRVTIEDDFFIARIHGSPGSPPPLVIAAVRRSCVRADTYPASLQPLLDLVQASVRDFLYLPGAPVPDFELIGVPEARH